MANLKFWNTWTIAGKIGAVISIGVITSILVIAIGGIGYLKKEYLTTFGKQQFTTVQAFAMYIDADLASKLKAITVVADATPAEALRDSSSAQQYLPTRVGIASLFDDGLMILSAEGRLLAEAPFISQERLGDDYSSHPFFQQVKKSGQSVISEPFYSLTPGRLPIIEFIAPIRDAQEKITAYVCGGLTLNGDNALGNIARHKIGNNGYFYIYSRDRTILIHQDTSRTMKNDVPPGANRLFDLALEGFDGSGETINSRGLHFMASFQHLKTTPWILAANLPVKEALAPFNTTRNLVLVTISLCGSLVILFSIWSLTRFMAPLNRFITHMKKCGEDSSAFEHEGGPEVTRLAIIFNQMLARMKESQAELRSNEELQRTLLNASPDIICFKDAEGRWLLANKAILTLFQLEGVDYQGKNDSELATCSPLLHDALLDCMKTDEQAWEHGSMLTAEETICTPDEENRLFEMIKAPLFHSNDSRKALVVIGHDITTRKKDEENIRKLSKAVEQSPVTIVITDIHGNIEFVNPAFTRLTGYTPAEVMGKNPRILRTGKTSPETHIQLWQTISGGKKWEGELYNKKKNGEGFVEHAVISPIFNQEGKITHYMAIKDDITAKKSSEEIIWRQANFDSLTQLCNRRLFHNRLENALHHSMREKSTFVLMFLDLDHFKEVNDTLGHDYGDLLLIEAAQRLQDCVRETDTVARFGGDEFALLLTNVKVDGGIVKVAGKILAALNQPFYLKEEVARVSASIGVTICPEDGNDVITLLKNADRSMYMAKDAGRNCWRSYTDVCEADSQLKREEYVEI